MEFLYGEKNSNAINSLLRSGKELKCAVAFWGKSVWDMLESSKRNIKIICNLDSGATNPFLIKRLLTTKNIKVLSHPQLHAKVYFTNELAIVGSANASANGLSFEDEELKGWMEAGLTVRDKSVLKEVERWFDDMWSKSFAITSEQINFAIEKWKNQRNRRNIGNTQKGTSLLSKLKVNPISFKDKEIYFAIYRCYASDEAKTKFKNIGPEFREIDELDFYEGWSDLPQNSTVISIYYGPKGGFNNDGIYWIPENKIIKKFMYKNGEQGDIIIVFQLKNIEGYPPLSAADKKLLKSKLKDIWNSKYARGDDDGKVISLYNSRNILF